MSPRTVGPDIRRECPLLRQDEPVEDAVRKVLDSGLPALPVIDERERLVGIFGEREFMTAIFPGYVGELSRAAFVPRSIESALQKRAKCRIEPVRKHMTTGHVDVTSDFADVQLAETFLHHRVLIAPVTEDHRVVGVVTRSDFFRALAERFIDR